jgi:hypothetical protein
MRLLCLSFAGAGVSLNWCCTGVLAPSLSFGLSNYAGREFRLDKPLSTCREPLGQSLVHVLELVF